MNKRMKVFLGAMAIVALGFLLAGQCVADKIISATADTSIALRCKNGDSSTLTVVVATNGEHIVVTVGGVTTNLTAGSSYDTIAELAAKIEALTNTSGTAETTVDKECSLDADSTDDELLDGTYTAAEGKWLNLLWDTSEADHYDIYLRSRTYQTGVAPYTLKKIMGEPTGTGNATLTIYLDGTAITRELYTSPVYVNPATMNMTGTVTNATVNTVNVDMDVNMPFSGEDPVIIRVTRTAATTGVMAVVIDSQ